MRRLLGSRNRRRGSRESWQGLRAALGAGLPLLGVVVVLWLGGPPLAAAVRRHPYFAVRDVVVAPHGRLGSAEVRALAGIEPGTSIWDVDPAAVEARLRASPWVRSAAVRRELPRRVTIRVRAERPVAILALRDGGPLWYVAPRGRIIAPVAPGDPHDYPFVTGLAATDLDAGQSTGPRALRRALGLLRQVNRLPGLEPVSEIAIDPVRGLELLLVRPAVPIEIGTGPHAAQLARLPRVLGLWAGRESEMAAVSLAFADQIIVRTRGPHSPARARRAT